MTTVKKIRASIDQTLDRREAAALALEEKRTATLQKSSTFASDMNASFAVFEVNENGEFPRRHGV